MSGYIRLHRKILDSYQFSNPEALKFWVWLLLKANHQDSHVSLFIGNGYSDVLVKRGQLIFGRKVAAKELKMSESKIYRILKKLSCDNSLDIKSNNRFSIITICKYDSYNGDKISNEQPVNSQRTASEQPVNTYKNDKNDKNDKNIININIYSTYEFFKNDFVKVWEEFLLMRKKIKKPTTSKAEILGLNSVKKLSGNNYDQAIAIVEQSILNCWAGFYEIKKIESGANIVYDKKKEMNLSGNALNNYHNDLRAAGYRQISNPQGYTIRWEK